MSEPVVEISRDSEIASLEWGVVEAAVEAAVAWRKAYDANSRYALERAIDALIVAREKAETPSNRR